MTVARDAFFVTGGTVPSNSSAYVVRSADDELFRSLQRGEFCFVLDTRQMGKSSLMIRTATRLRQAGSAVAVLDLTSVGQNITVSQWYFGLLTRVGEQLSLEDDMIDFWQERCELGPMQRFFEALRYVAMPALDRRAEQGSEPSLVVFVDEIDGVRALAFSTDEFFAGIRECYNRRPIDPVLSRLTFCLLGVATPADLISDTRISPFNIGRRVDLGDFSSEEASVLAPGLGPNSGALLKRILYWTGGHPYLTQRLCRAAVSGAHAGSITSPRDIDGLCRELFLSSVAREDDDNLAFVHTRLLTHGDDAAALLALYGRVHSSLPVPDDRTSELCDALKLSGVARAERGRLVVRNRIYARVFDPAWIRDHMPGSELRRQRAAFLKGVIRTAVVSGAVVMVLLGLTRFAFHEKMLSDANAQLAYQRAIESRHATDEARGAAQLAAIREQEATRNAKRAQHQEARALREERKAARLAKAERKARQEAGLQRDVAVRERANAKREAEVNRLNRYVAEVSRAQRELDADAFPRAVALLEAQRPAKGEPDLRDFTWRYLRNLARDSSNATLTYGNDTPRTEDVTPDGKLVAVGYRSGAIRLWSLGTHTVTAEFHASPDEHPQVCFGQGGRVLIASTREPTTWVWDLRKHVLQFKLKTDSPSRTVRCSWDGHTVAIGCEDGNVHLYDLRSGIETGTLRASSVVTALAFTADGSRLVVGRDSGLAQIWSLHNRTLEGSVVSGRDELTCVATSPDATMLATGNVDGRLRLWELDSRRMIAELTGRSEVLNALDFSPSSPSLLSAGDDGAIRIWDLHSRTPSARYYGHRAAALSALYAVGGSRIVSAAADGVKIWSVSAEELHGPAPDFAASRAGANAGMFAGMHAGQYSGLQTAVDYGRDGKFRPHGLTLTGATARSFNSNVTRNKNRADTRSGPLSIRGRAQGAEPQEGRAGSEAEQDHASRPAPVREQIYHVGSGRYVNCPADFSSEATITSGGNAIAVRWIHSEKQTILSCAGQPVGGPSYALDGRSVMAVSSHTVIVSHDVITGAVKASVSLPVLNGSDIRQSGSIAATMTSDDRVTTWNLLTGDKLATIPVGQHYDWAIAPGGTYVVTHRFVATVKQFETILWNMQTGESHTLCESPDVMYSYMSHDTVAVCIPGSGNVRVYSYGNAWLISNVTLPASSSPWRFSSNGRFVAVAQKDGQISIWNDITGRRGALLHANGETPAAVSNDGAFLATTHPDGSNSLLALTIRDTRTGSAIMHARGILSAGFHVPILAPAAQYLVTVRINPQTRHSMVERWDVKSGTSRPLLQAQGIVLECEAGDRYLYEQQQDLVGVLWSLPSGAIKRLTHLDPRMWGAWTLPDVECFLVIGQDRRTVSLTSLRLGRDFARWQLPAPVQSCMIHYGRTAKLDLVDGSSENITLTGDGFSRALIARRDAGSWVWRMSARELKTGQEREVWRGMVTDDMYAPTPDGSVLWVRTEDTRRVALISLDTGRPIALLEGHTEPITYAIASQDSTLLATCDKDIRIWDAHTGRLLSVMLGTTGNVVNAWISPDKLTLLTGSTDRTVRTWNVTTGQELAVFHLPARPRFCTFSNDGNSAQALDEDGDVHFWRAPTLAELDKEFP
jgi:WD40 repeat protein